jgi:hypothetical protein
VTVSNPAAVFRKSETVELNWPDLKKRIPSLTDANASVFDAKRNRFLVTQRTDDILLFQSDWSPNENRIFWIGPARRGFQIPGPANGTFAKFAPRRKDDFARDNDRIAHPLQIRMTE